MKTITLAFALLFGTFLLTGCNETKDTTENESEQKNEVTSEVKSNDETTMKEKSGEENKMETTETKTKDVANKDAKLETASFKCETMTCTGCEQTITGKVKKMDGVQDVKADYKSKNVEVTFASNVVSKDEIAKTIEASGYKCEVNN